MLVTTLGHRCFSSPTIDYGQLSCFWLNRKSKKSCGVMICVRNKASQIGQYLKASSSAVASQSRPVVNVIPKSNKDERFPSDPEAVTSNALANVLPHQGRTMVVAGSFSAGQQIRLAHTDIQVPNFDVYRVKSRLNPTVLSPTTQEGAKMTSYLIVGASVVAGTCAAKGLVTTFVSNLSASAEVLALAKIEIKLSDIPEGVLNVLSDIAFIYCSRKKIKQGLTP